jgi:hypothetical protein
MDPLLCENCGGCVHLPGLYHCDNPCHPVPTPAQEIVAALEADLNDRRGMHVSSLADATASELRSTWERIICGILSRRLGLDRQESSAKIPNRLTEQSSVR